MIDQRPVRLLLGGMRREQSASMHQWLHLHPVVVTLLAFELFHETCLHYLHTSRLIFVCLTNILLITSLISLVSNSLTEVGQSSETLSQVVADLRPSD